jgi:hypothetical protein
MVLRPRRAGSVRPTRVAPIRALLLGVGAIAVVAVLLAHSISSPDRRPVTIEQWSRARPLDFAGTAIGELAGTTATAELAHIDTAINFVLGPVRSVSGPRLRREIAEFERVGPALKEDGIHSYETALKRAHIGTDGSVKIAPGLYEYVNNIIDRLVKLAQGGGLDRALLGGRPVHQADRTELLAFLGDGGAFGSRATAQLSPGLLVMLVLALAGLVLVTGRQASVITYAVWQRHRPLGSSVQTPGENSRPP